MIRPFVNLTISLLFYEGAGYFDLAGIAVIFPGRGIFVSGRAGHWVLRVNSLRLVGDQMVFAACFLLFAAARSLY